MGKNKILFVLVLILAVIASLAVSTRGEAAAVVPSGAMQNYCVIPPFIGAPASPLVMLMVQRDEKLFRKAYDDFSDLDGDGVLDITYKHSVNYYGYFDPYKCYAYSDVDGRFNVSSMADADKYCYGSYWSGNFLNWATMTRIDIIRKAFFGGNRGIDSPTGTPAATLVRAFLPQDAHSFVKTYSCADAANCDINGLTPYKTHPKKLTDLSTISLCSTTLDSDGDGNLDPAKDPPIMRVAADDDGEYYRFNSLYISGWERWASNGRWQCALKGEKTEGDDTLRPGANDHLGDFIVEVEACKPGYLGTERCKLYEQHNNYMPIGVVQEYGEDSSMYFGLITGSYDRNKSGGVLRAELSDFGDLNSSDVNRTTGQFTANAGIFPVVRELAIQDYDYTDPNNADSIDGNGTYNDTDNCPWGQASFADGSCKNWGNPLAEMYYEALRYFAGKDTPTPEYDANDGLTTQTWNSQLDPYNRPIVQECSKAFILMISDPYPSYDSDQLPGSYFPGAIMSDLPMELPPLNVAELAREIGDTEGIHGSGEKYFVGNVDGSAEAGAQNGLCTPKTIDDLSKVRGLCPVEPGREGSYYLPAVAYYGHKNDLRPGESIEGAATYPDNFPKTGNQNISAYAVALEGGNPELNIDAGGSKVKIIPACFNPTTGTPCRLVDFKYIGLYEYLSFDFNVYYFSWEDTQQGGDYDADVDGQLWIRTVPGSSALRVFVVAGNKTTGEKMYIGYVISGTTNDGLKLTVRVNEICTNPSHTWLIPGTLIYNTKCWNFQDYTAGLSTTAGKSLESPLWYAAKYGGYNEINETPGPDLESEWDANHDGKPDTYFEVSNPLKMEQKLVEAFTSILNRVTSGTAASVLASGEGSGANLVQAVYYPRRRFFDSEIGWIGSLHNFWYYVDPFFTYSTIREDTVHDRKFDLVDDNIIHMYFDHDAQKTRSAVFKDSNGDGSPDSFVGIKEFGDVDAIWKAGYKLWARDVDPTSANYDMRQIFIYNGTNKDKMRFDNENFNDAPTAKARATLLAPYLNMEDRDSSGDNLDETIDLIRYLNGEHIVVDRDSDGVFDYRSRVAGIDLNDDGDIFDTLTKDIDYDGTAETVKESNVWKLGDIIDSTPRIASYKALNQYQRYGDYTYKQYIGDTDLAFCISGKGDTNKCDYKERGMVYVGANDGMLHAFRLGEIEQVNTGTTLHKLLGTDLGREEWAFIPMNALPYLKFIADPNYCHINTVDLTPHLVDASIYMDPEPIDKVLDPATGDPKKLTQTCAGDDPTCVRGRKSWATILIGGMRLGGACNAKGTVTKNGVEAPVEVDYDKDGTADSIGYSAYFALDITDEDNPKILWEFWHEDLGFATTGPSIIRVNTQKKDAGGNVILDALGKPVQDKTTNGHWFAVFGSGSTGPIETTYHQFKGFSEQPLKFFVLDLRTGDLKRTIETGIPYAFASTMTSVAIDADQDYSDDALYAGYTRSEGDKGMAWTAGGVGRLVTNEDPDPANWVWTRMIDSTGTPGDDGHIGPVTASAQPGYYKGDGTQWVFFNTGRYYYKTPKELDDQSGQQYIYGVIDQCYEMGNAGTYKAKCADNASLDEAAVMSDAATLKLAADNTSLDYGLEVKSAGGWKIALDVPAAETGFGAERSFTDPVVTAQGYTFFTTFKPYDGACVLGGQSYLWVVDSLTGGVPVGLKGRALIQVSTGAIEEIDLSEALTKGSDEENRGKRRTTGMEGIPPTVPPSTATGTEPRMKVVHIRER